MSAEIKLYVNASKRSGFNEIMVIGAVAAGTSAAAKSPVHYTGMILDNALNNNRPLITAKEIQNLISNDEKIQVLDARVNKQYEESHVDTAINMPHSKLREELEKLDKDVLTITYCNKGVTGNAAQNILINHGFKKVYNLSGGYKFYSSTKK